MGRFLCTSKVFVFSPLLHNSKGWNDFAWTCPIVPQKQISKWPLDWSQGKFWDEELEFVCKSLVPQKSQESQYGMKRQIFFFFSVITTRISQGRPLMRGVTDCSLCMLKFTLCLHVLELFCRSLQGKAQVVLFSDNFSWSSAWWICRLEPEKIRGFSSNASY